MKRLLDVVIAASGLVLLMPVLGVIALLVKLTSPGPAIFRQQRVGRAFRPFELLKFRTMVPDVLRRGAQITVENDPRITRFGRLLRKSKIDELPQLLNVLKGEMSLVGPRPEVPKYVDLFRDDFRHILAVRPGITDLASLAYRDESAILARAQDPEREYRERILPHKIRLAKEYVRRQSLSLDLEILFRTILTLAAARLPRLPFSRSYPAERKERQETNGPRSTQAGSAQTR